MGMLSLGSRPIRYWWRIRTDCCYTIMFHYSTKYTQQVRIVSDPVSKHARCSMSLHVQDEYQVPVQTAHVAQAIFPDGNLVMQMYDELGMLLRDADFVDL